MKKSKRYVSILIQRKREKKAFKRRRKRRFYRGTPFTFPVHRRVEKLRENIDRIKINSYRSDFYNFFLDKKFINGDEQISTLIKFPQDFSFSSNYDVAIKTIGSFITSVNRNKEKEITLDFSKCTQADQPALFVLQIIRKEFTAEFTKLGRTLSFVSSRLEFKCIQSLNEHVNKLLLLTGLISQAELKLSGLLPIHASGYFKGIKSQKHYHENKKGTIATNLVAYINSCLSSHGYCFDPWGKSYMDGLVSEILNNSEDHSHFGCYYVTANLMREHLPEVGELIGELNVSILNFGYSYFEGFEETKQENHDIYSQMEQLHDQVNNGFFSPPFTKENLFTLYALQDGMSRLKYIEDSRGTGTMKFINSFLLIGDYEDSQRGYFPKLTILTGRTQLICDNQFKPFKQDGVYFVSLNKENSLGVLPEKSHLKSLNKYFPGTLITAKIYLNQTHLNKKYNANGGNIEN